MAHITAAYTPPRELTALSKKELVAECARVEALIGELQRAIFSQTAAVTSLAARVAISEREYTLLLSETNLTIEDLTRQITALTTSHAELAAKSELAERASKEKETAYLAKIRALEDSLAIATEEARVSHERFREASTGLHDALSYSERYGKSLHHILPGHRLWDQLIVCAVIECFKKYFKEI